MSKPDVSRRDFVKTSAIATAGTMLGSTLLAHAQGTERLDVGLIGCGGRGTGAAHNALEADERFNIVALADLFADRLESCRDSLSGASDRGQVARDRCYVGFDAYKELIDSTPHVVILATPPHFRPMHFATAVDAGVHVFMEKPVAVDPAGIRMVLDAARRADEKGLSVVAGTQRRHEASYLAAMEQVASGRLGRIVSARCAWNMGGLWMKQQRPEWSDMEWQVRNWLYFTWLSGDHIVEQHVHNLDVVNWAMQTHPIRAMGMGGRQVRTARDYGQVFDHFAIEYEYPGDVFVTSFCRQTDGCASRVEEAIHGTEGMLTTRPGYAVIDGKSSWEFEGRNPNPYVQEHRDLLHSILSGPRLNEAKRVAESTLTAIMGRMSAYTGQVVSWEDAIDSNLDLTPPAYAFGDLPIGPVAVPGKTKLT